MTYSINVARDVNKPLSGCKPSYHFFFRVEGIADRERVHEILEGFKQAYPAPTYKLDVSCQDTFSRTLTKEFLKS